MFDTQGSHHGSGFSSLPGMRVDGIVGNQLTGSINHCHFHPSTQTRIEAHSGAHPRRSGHQQILHVTSEYIDSLVFRSFAQGAHQLGFQMHQHLNTPCPVDHGFAPAVSRCIIQA